MLLILFVSVGSSQLMAAKSQARLILRGYIPKTQGIILHKPKVIVDARQKIIQNFEVHDTAPIKAEVSIESQRGHSYALRKGFDKSMSLALTDQGAEARSDKVFVVLTEA